MLQATQMYLGSRYLGLVRWSYAFAEVESVARAFLGVGRQDGAQEAIEHAADPKRWSILWDVAQICGRQNLDAAASLEHSLVGKPPGPGPDSASTESRSRRRLGISTCIASTSSHFSFPWPFIHLQ